MNPNDPKTSRERFRKSRRTDEFYHYATKNKGPLTTYILLALGIILVFINSFLGSLLIGGITGYYFTSEMISSLRNFTSFTSNPDEQVRYVTLAALCLALLIEAPGIVIGAIIGAILHQATTNKPSNLYDRDYRDRY